jgi:Lrp/AsnC family transcriptional regulator for asnA, asnC and gidA
VDFDEIDAAIIRQLHEGRKSFKDVAKQVGLAENTARSRINKLLNSEILHIHGVVDPSKIPDQLVILVGIKLATMNGVKKGEEISKLRNVISVFAVTGQFDLIALVTLNKEFGLREFITEELDRVKDIRSAETFVVYHSFNLKTPLL